VVSAFGVDDVGVLVALEVLVKRDLGGVLQIGLPLTKLSRGAMWLSKSGRPAS
jgi:hypothetical protein